MTWSSPVSVTLLWALSSFAAHRALVGSAQSLPLVRFDGFVYVEHRVDARTVVIEAFLDPVCPDSRDTWLPLKQAVDHYRPRVWLVVHLLPLPYHDNAYVASRALNIVNLLNTSATSPLLELFFKEQVKFYNAQTVNMSKSALVNYIANFATQVVANSLKYAVLLGFQNSQTDIKTRVSFKYSASRGVFGTPTFFVNGLSLPDSDSSIDYEGWRSIIDPLIAAQGDPLSANVYPTILLSMICSHSKSLSVFLCLCLRLSVCLSLSMLLMDLTSRFKCAMVGIFAALYKNKTFDMSIYLKACWFCA